jgi:hypothetical protein
MLLPLIMVASLQTQTSFYIDAFVLDWKSSYSHFYFNINTMVDTPTILLPTSAAPIEFRGPRAMEFWGPLLKRVY